MCLTLGVKLDGTKLLSQHCGLQNMNSNSLPDTVGPTPLCVPTICHSARIPVTAEDVGEILKNWDTSWNMLEDLKPLRLSNST